MTLEFNNWNNLFINNFESFRDTKIILKRQARLHCMKSIKFLRLLAVRDDIERIIIFFLSLTRSLSFPRFDPERFNPEVVKKRPAIAYSPFGLGQRRCPGTFLI